MLSLLMSLRFVCICGVISCNENTVPLSEEGRAKRREFDKKLHSKLPTNMINSHHLRVLPLHKEGELFT